MTVDAETLMRQAWMTSDEYLRQAITCIDERFNTPGYAKTHPELVAAFMTVAATDFNTTMMSRALENIANCMSDMAIQVSGGVSEYPFSVEITK